MPDCVFTTNHWAPPPIEPTWAKSVTMSKGTFSYMPWAIVLSIPVIVKV